MWSRAGRPICLYRQLTPFSERGSAVLLEDIAAVEVAVVVEVVVDRGMGGGGGRGILIIGLILVLPGLVVGGALSE